MKKPFTEAEFLKKRIADLEEDVRVLALKLPAIDWALRETILTKMATFSERDRDSRITHANLVLHTFATTGRKLFSHEGLHGQFFVCGGKLSYRDPWTKRSYVDFNRLSIGAGCKTLLIGLSNFIDGKGKLPHQRFSHFGYGDLIRNVLDVMVQNGVMEPGK